MYVLSTVEGILASNGFDGLLPTALLDLTDMCKYSRLFSSYHQSVLMSVDENDHIRTLWCVLSACQAYEYGYFNSIVIMAHR